MTRDHNRVFDLMFPNVNVLLLSFKQQGQQKGHLQVLIHSHVLSLQISLFEKLISHDGILITYS